MGRPTKRTPTVEEIITEGIRTGLPYKFAAARAGIAYETLREWLKAGEEGNPNLSAFSQAVRQAEADGVHANLVAITRSPDWRARAWVLEHRHPEEFGGKSKLELSGDPDRPVAPTIIKFIAPVMNGTTEDGDNDAA
jgi:hypothetical protein